MKNHDSDKNYYEELALQILLKKELIPNTFIKGETPDWHSNKDNIGIEVTNTDQSIEFSEWINNIENKEKKNIKKFNKKYKKLGGKILDINHPLVKILDLKTAYNFDENYIYIIPSYDGSFKVIKEAIKRKMDKLNNNYTKFKDNRLAIFTTNIITNEIIQEELIELLNISNSKPTSFNTIYLITFENIFIININKKSFSKLKINKEELQKPSINLYKKNQK